NNAPDTLSFIWIHLWPNAYKNDRTAFSDQLLENGNTNFYFSNADKRGYINRLDFKVNGMVVKMEDHPEHQDIIKIHLNQPLLPGATCKIQTPFHVQLPYTFSRGGHTQQAFQITQWYPKPAVYDHKGWHPIPYLDQGEFYSEWGNYKVQITVPQNYVVAATGELQDQTEKDWLLTKMGNIKVAPKVKSIIPNNKDKKTTPPIATASISKTLHFIQDNVHDFAWFADKNFRLLQDTLLLPNGKTITAQAYFLPGENTPWLNSISFIKNAVLSRSKWVGIYPYNIVAAVEANQGAGGGMEYPTITAITPDMDAEDLEGTIEHEVGHNWFYGILASPERDFPWMDEGMNTYYDMRYKKIQLVPSKPEAKKGFFEKRIPEDAMQLGLDANILLKKDQPISSSSTAFNYFNYGVVGYQKTGLWMKLLEERLGQSVFDSCMQAYYQQWQFKHPYPEDFRKVVESVSQQNLDDVFALLDKKGPLVATINKKQLKFTSFFNLTETDKYRYIAAAPAFGYNKTDQFMLGALIHNYTYPSTGLQFLFAPLYATGSKQMNGLGTLGYTWLPGKNGQKATLNIAAASFNSDAFVDSTGTKNYLRFSKIAPSFTYHFAPKNPKSTVHHFIQLKSFFITEQALRFDRDTVNQLDVISYPKFSRYLNQFRYVVENNRALYPYDAEFKVEQGKQFIRLAITGNYFFNYPSGGGLDMRLFAGKFFYLTDKTFLTQFETDPYHLNMTGPKGYEDYTYSNYYVGRNEFDGFAAQQIMNRDGFFKVRTDLLSSKIGKTDNWLAALNFTSTIPKAINPLEILPFKIPLKVFVDIGTYAEAWDKNSTTGRFLYDAGLQLSIFKNMVTVYVPILYSKVYQDYFKSTITEKRFVKNISFSINLHRLNLRKAFPQIPQ
ncbi:MAG: M1 family metallopeptidase, partial [Ferruginibacter sp.]